MSERSRVYGFWQYTFCEECFVHLYVIVLLYLNMSCVHARASLDHCFCAGPTYSPFSSVFGEEKPCGENEDGTPIQPQMYQSLHLPNTSISNFNQYSKEYRDDESYEVDEFSSLPHQAPSLPIHAGGRYV